jgi:hypothetical protein
MSMTAWRMLTWELVARNRWLFWPCVAFLVLASLVCPLLPPALRVQELGMTVSFLLVPPGMVVLAALAHGFEGRLEGRESIFPARLFTMPVSTAGLTGPPLLLGTVVVGGGWLLLAGCVLRPCGFETDLAWPAAYMAAILAWIQALAWTPFRLPGLRLLVGSIVLSVLGIAPLLLRIKGIDEAELATGLAALVALAYLTATVGVARARHGAGQEEPAGIEVVAGSAAGEQVKPLSSSLKAQLWYEWRLNRWGLLFLTVLFLGWSVAQAQMILVLLRSDHLPWMWPWLVQPAEQAGEGWLCVPAMILFGPVLLALALGPDLVRMTPQARKQRLPAFFATLPLDVTGLLRGKLIFTGLVMLASWALAAAAAVTWAALHGLLGEMADQVVGLTGSAPAALALVVVVFLMAVVVNWLWLLRESWVGMAGWSSWVWVPVALGFATWLVAASVVHRWLTWPEARPVMVTLAIVALALKSATVAWVVWRTHREGLVRGGVLAGLIAGWLVLATVTGGLVCWLVGGSAAAFAGVVLLLPLARPLAMPLALAHNRHG